MITETKKPTYLCFRLYTSVFDLIWSLKRIGQLLVIALIKYSILQIQVYSILYDHWNFQCSQCYSSILIQVHSILYDHWNNPFAKAIFFALIQVYSILFDHWNIVRINRLFRLLIQVYSILFDHWNIRPHSRRGN